MIWKIINRITLAISVIVVMVWVWMAVAMPYAFRWWR